MFPLIWWGNCRWLAPAHKHVNGLVRTRYCHVTTHLIHCWFARNLKIQSFWVQGPTVLFTSPQTSPEPPNDRGGGVSFFCWYETHGFSTNTIQFQTPSNSQHPVGKPLSIDVSYQICGVSANDIGWVIQTVLTSKASHVILSHSYFWPSD